ncbi:hypothetical protein GCM10009853_009860 [Glycomyces scopariae]
MAVEDAHLAKLEARLQHALQQHFAADHAALMGRDVQHQHGLFQFSLYWRSGRLLRLRCRFRRRLHFRRLLHRGGFGVECRFRRQRRLMFMRQIVNARLAAHGRLRLLRLGRFFVRRVVVQQDVIVLRPLRQRRRRLMSSRLNGAGRRRSRRSGLRRDHGFFACGIEMAE